MIKKTTYKCEHCSFETDDYDKMVEHEKFPCQLYIFTLNFEPLNKAGVMITYEKYPFNKSPITFREGLRLMGNGGDPDGPAYLCMQIRETDEATAYNKFIKAVEEWFTRKMHQTNVCISRLNDKGLNIKKLEVPLNELSSRS